MTSGLTGGLGTQPLLTRNLFHNKKGFAAWGRVGAPSAVADPTNNGTGYNRQNATGAVDLQVPNQAVDNTAALVGSSVTQPGVFGTGSLAIGASNRITGCGNLAIGIGNTVSGSNSSAALGARMTVSGAASTGIGDAHTVSASNALALGYFCTADAIYSFVQGAENRTRGLISSHVQGMNDGSGHYFQGYSVPVGAYTTNATPTTLKSQSGAVGLALANDTTWAFSILVSARRTDVNDESAAYKFEGCIDRNANAASTALVGTVTKTVLAEDTAAWDCDVTADATNGALAITCTGEAAKNILWTGFVTIAESNG